jgi:hypothetical protein
MSNKRPHNFMDKWLAQTFTRHSGVISNDQIRLTRAAAAAASVYGGQEQTWVNYV